MDDLDNIATFAFHNTYPDAPCPVLRIVGLDIVGLPLSIREAESIHEIAASSQSAHDDSQDMWILDASQVRSMNLFTALVCSLCLLSAAHRYNARILDGRYSLNELHQMPVSIWDSGFAPRHIISNYVLFNCLVPEAGKPGVPLDNLIN